MQVINDEIRKIQQDTGILFNLEATPAEGATYRLALMDKKLTNNKIICANEDGEEPFYTNSTHLPVNSADDLFEGLELQDELQTMYTGGTVHHIYLDELVEDTTTVKNLVKKVTSLFKLPYFTLTPTFSICPSHGYLIGEQYTCNICGKETEVYSRTVGYYRPIKQWNKGKQAEFNMRKTFKLGENK